MCIRDSTHTHTHNLLYTLVLVVIFKCNTQTLSIPRWHRFFIIYIMYVFCYCRLIANILRTLIFWTLCLEHIAYVCAQNVFKCAQPHTNLRHTSRLIIMSFVNNVCRQSFSCSKIVYSCRLLFYNIAHLCLCLYQTALCCEACRWRFAGNQKVTILILVESK